MAFGEDRQLWSDVEGFVRMTLDAIAAPALALNAGEIIHANPEAELMLGARSRDLVGKRVDALWSTPSRVSPALRSGVPSVVSLLSGEEVLAELRDAAGFEVLTLRNVDQLIAADGHAARRMIRLQAVTSLLSRASTEAEVAAVVVRYAVEATGSDTGGVLYSLRADGWLELLAQHGVPTQVQISFGRLPPDSDTPAAYAVRTRRAVWIETAEDYEALYPEMAKVIRPATRAQALCVIPVIAAGRTLGVMGMGFTKTRSFPPSERTFIGTMTEQCAQALDRARAYDYERRAREEAERARAAREELLAIVAHDLKNPLGMIVLAASALARRTTDETVRKNAQHILHATERMERLTHDLLDAASIESGKLSLTRVEGVDLGLLVEEALALQIPQAEAKGVSLERGVDAPVPVFADRDRIAQVLANLTSNAVKFTPDGGVVRVAVDVHATGARVSVSDTGPGIGEDQLARLFGRFERGRHVGSETGLGLYIAKGIVEAHGGALDVTTTLGGGTVFSFSLPARGGASSG